MLDHYPSDRIKNNRIQQHMDSVVRVIAEVEDPYASCEYLMGLSSCKRVGVKVVEMYIPAFKSEILSLRADRHLELVCDEHAAMRLED